jgi:hypothetical protein
MTRKVLLGLVTGWIAAASLSKAFCAAQAQTVAPPAIVGIRPGTPIGDAYQMLKQHGANGVIQYGQKRLDVLADTPITYAMLWSATGSQEDREIVEVDLNFPPNDQKVWRISRRISFPPDHEPLAEAMMNSLRKTFGKELPSSAPDHAFWAFDTQGRPVQGRGVEMADCALYLDLPELSGTVLAFASAKTSSTVSPNVALAPTVVAANREQCRQFVFVAANLAAEPGNRATIRFVSVTITDIGAGIRAGTATQAALNGAASAQQQNALKKAKEQPVPQY